MLEKFRPNEIAAGLAQIDLDKLSKRGIKGIICDIDNTLLLYTEDIPQKREWEWVERAKDKFSLILLSNALPRRATSLSQTLGIPAEAQAIKPSRKGFRRALKVLNLQVEDVAVIGDQIFTDILGGNRMGMYTILVTPLGSKEFFSTKILRFFERWIIKHLRLREVDITPVKVETADTK